MSLPTGSSWRIERGSVPDQIIEITSTAGEKFTGRYVDIDNTSAFTGEVWTREKTMIYIKQYHGGAGYVAFQTGLKHATENRYDGTWYDVAGNSGPFHLIRL